VSQEKNKRMVISGSVLQRTEQGMAATLERIASLLES
jgi:hypothetical protein